MDRLVLQGKVEVGFPLDFLLISLWIPLRIPEEAKGKSKGNPKDIKGKSRVRVDPNPGFPLDFPWISLWISLGFPWISLVFPGFPSRPLDFPWISVDFPRISLQNPPALDPKP